MTRRTRSVENMLMTRAKTVEKRLRNIYFLGVVRIPDGVDATFAWRFA
jgi:hypothetical protein